jgi:hypothetical protein
MVTLRPAGADRAAGVVVALHGLGADAASTAAVLAAAMTAAGTEMTVITADGGTTYWHRRADGDDPQGMILHEVLPRAAAMGLPTAGPSTGRQILRGMTFSPGYPPSGTCRPISPVARVTHSSQWTDCSGRGCTG